MTPRLAVAVNLAQFVARANHSRLSLTTTSKQTCLIILNREKQHHKFNVEICYNHSLQVHASFIVISVMHH